MTQSRDQDPVAPFPKLPAQVSSASSLTSHASSNASSNASGAAKNAQTSTTMLNTPLGLIANNYGSAITNSTTASNPNYNATAAALASASIVSGTVPEFLYQLTKMLTDPNNKIIEWSTYSGNGRIEVHDPSRLESEVLSRYFRHSKYSSFQRQLNYFGFRKIAGKGKMSPCSYVNDAATLDIRSLLLMKRKGSEKEKNSKAAAAAAAAATAANVSDAIGKDSTLLSSSSVHAGMKRTNPGNEIQPATVQPMFHNAQRNISFDTMAATVAKNIAESRSQQRQQQVERSNEEFNEIKRTKLDSSSSSSSRGYTVAQGKGIRHQLNGYLRPSSSGSINNTSSAPTASATSEKKNQTWSDLPNTSGPPTSTSNRLQFLDPNELGMSVSSTSYLNQLKNNFAAVATDDAGTSSSSSSAVPTSSSDGISSGTGSQPQSSANDDTSSSTVTRVSSQASFMGMLRRDDSLINLAMLPTLDSTANSTGYASNQSSNTDGETPFGFIDYNASYTDNS